MCMFGFMCVSTQFCISLSLNLQQIRRSALSILELAANSSILNGEGLLSLSDCFIWQIMKHHQVVPPKDARKCLLALASPPAYNVCHQRQVIGIEGIATQHTLDVQSGLCHIVPKLPRATQRSVPGLHA